MSTSLCWLHSTCSYILINLFSQTLSNVSVDLVMSRKQNDVFELVSWVTLCCLIRCCLRVSEFLECLFEMICIKPELWWFQSSAGGQRSNRRSLAEVSSGWLAGAAGTWAEALAPVCISSQPDRGMEPEPAWERAGGFWYWALSLYSGARHVVLQRCPVGPLHWP